MCVCVYVAYVVYVYMRSVVSVPANTHHSRRPNGVNVLLILMNKCILFSVAQTQGIVIVARIAWGWPGELVGPAIWAGQIATTA